MKKFSVFLAIIAIFSSSSCDSDQEQAGIPFVFVNEQVDLRSVLYPRLQNDGGYAYITAGYKGIIIYREDASTYRAFERACTFDPVDPCSILQVDESELFIIDKCCRSTFDFEGLNTGGPANRPLLEYQTRLEGGFLIVTNE